MAVLQLVDDGRVDLDTDVNRYLKRLKVPAAGYPPLTLRHLLTHTGGLDELPGRQFDGREPQDLASFLRGPDRPLPRARHADRVFDLRHPGRRARPRGRERKVLRRVPAASTFSAQPG